MGATKDCEADESSPVPRPATRPIPRQAPARVRAGAGNYTSRRSVAQRVSSCRFDSCSLRSTDDTCVSTVLTEMKSSRDLLVGVTARDQPQHLALPLGQPIEVLVEWRYVGRREGIKDKASQSRREHGVVFRYTPDRVSQVGTGDRLGHVPPPPHGSRRSRLPPRPTPIAPGTVRPAASVRAGAAPRRRHRRAGARRAAPHPGSTPE